MEDPVVERIKLDRAIGRGFREPNPGIEVQPIYVDLNGGYKCRYFFG